MKAFQKVLVSIATLLFAALLVAFWLIGEKFEHNPTDFVHVLYGELYHENSKTSSLDKADDIYSSNLLSLIKKEQQEQLSSGELGKLSADPLCNCQDPASVTVIDITPLVTEGEHASVRVTLSVSGNTQDLTLNLIKETGGWKVADVTSDSIPSLLAYLK
ncbi:MAG: YbjP/YqhG family protein [Burkholderiales bacterium]|jgi:hypothetical protein|uniref:DUF3828 domain-containing protein n=1 Tax=Limnobacter sp. TaxID=2003368 RepID=UPI0039BCED7A|nr:YbjP/YqhG family protein [Burkholderiales bacterium]